jgi:hypothetical protein
MPLEVNRGKYYIKKTLKGSFLIISWWLRVDSNYRPRAYESPALPLSYAAALLTLVSYLHIIPERKMPNRSWELFLVAGVGFEPTTSGL